MTPKELILSYCIPHVCTQGRCPQRCPDGCLEFPSIIFIDAVGITKARRYDGTSLAPD